MGEKSNTFTPTGAISPDAVTEGTTTTSTSNVVVPSKDDSTPSSTIGTGVVPTKEGNNNDDDDEDDIIPMEMSADEYRDLVSQVQGLTLEEAQEEWMESCRHGEVDVVRALAENFIVNVTPVDPKSESSSSSATGDVDDGSVNDPHRHPLIGYVQPETANTGLHMACANGHLTVVKLLVGRYRHGCTRNSKGNTPLHWAAANGQVDTVRYLTSQTTVEVDVLEKNEFGRSALTEGFTSQQTEVVKSLLEHDSASEEKLLATGKGPDEQQEHIHYLFDADRPLKIRELAIKNADNPFADTDRPDEDTTGLSIWSASLVMARWMRSICGSWKEGATILELGSGCGVPGLAIATSAAATSGNDDQKRPRRVYLTDLNPQTVENLQYNIELNDVQDFVESSCMDWSNQPTWPKEQVDYAVGSDLIYQQSLVPLLMSVIFGTVKEGGVFLYVAPDTGRAGIEDFIAEMKIRCPGWKEQVAPKEYHSNPLTNGDDEECFLHFQELSSLTYMLYEFPIPTTGKEQ